MIIAKPPISIRRAVRTFKENYQNLESEYNKNVESQPQNEIVRLRQKTGIAFRSALLTVSSELSMLTMI